MKLLLVDDHVLFRRGLVSLLSELDDELTVVDVGLVEEVDIGHPHDYDLALLDMELPGGVSGLPALAELRSRLPDVPIVVVSGEMEPTLVRTCIDRGASGYIPKSSSPEMLISALRHVLTGGVSLPSLLLDETRVGFWNGAQAREPASLRPPVSASGLNPGGPAEKAGGDQHRLSDDSKALIGDALSPRQLEALLHAVQGKSNKAIARAMHIAEGTVKLHLSAAYRTLEVENRTQAVFVVAKLGLRRNDA